MNWTKEKYQIFWKALKKEKNEQYRIFSKKIIPTNYTMIGIKTPLLKRKASFIAKENASSYLAIAKDKTYEEVLMQGFVIGKLKEKEDIYEALISFVPKIDNWAICDLTIANLKRIKDDKAYFLPLVDTFLQEEFLFARRVGLILLLYYYVEDAFLDAIFRRILQTKGDEYYIDMAKAWLLCECFIVNKEKTYSFLETMPLTYSILSKTVQKICDSYRVLEVDKERVRALRKQKKSILKKQS